MAKLYLMFLLALTILVHATARNIPSDVGTTLTAQSTNKQTVTTLEKLPTSVVVVGTTANAKGTTKEIVAAVDATSAPGDGAGGVDEEKNFIAFGGVGGFAGIGGYASVLPTLGGSGIGGPGGSGGGSGLGGGSGIGGLGGLPGVGGGSVVGGGGAKGGGVTTP